MKSCTLHFFKTSQSSLSFVLYGHTIYWMMSNKCKSVRHFLLFTWHIVQHATSTGRKYFLINEYLNIKSYLPYLLENKPQVTFFWNEILQRTSVFILLLILNLAVFMHFLFSHSWSIFLLCSLISCLIFESAYSQRSAYFRGNMVCVKFQLIVRKILVLSNLPPQNCNFHFYTKFVLLDVFSNVATLSLGLKRSVRKIIFQAIFINVATLSDLKR